MPHATRPGGPLIPIKDCYINIPGAGYIVFNNLPDISDSKSASYNDETVIGRSSPLKTYSASDNRVISVQIHMIVTEPSDIEYNIQVLRWIQSAVYPRVGGNGAPFIPPPVCQIKCGKLLAEEELCVVLKSYNTKFPTEVAWDAEDFTPFKFDIDTNWEVVYKSSDLPGQDRIVTLGK